MKKITTLIVTIIIMICLSTEIKCAIFANDLGRDPGTGNGTEIEGYVIEGSAYFFKAKTSLDSLFYEGELAAKENKLNTQNCISYINGALLNLNMSKAKYKKAIAITNLTTFSESKISTLKTFDYDKYANQNGHLSEVMAKVKMYLSNCDIAGFYQQIITDIDVIIKQLESMRSNIESNIEIKPTEYWDLLTNLEILTIFGNYGTRIGRTIL